MSTDKRGLTAAVLILLAGCEFDGKTQPVGAASFRHGYDKHCIDGVTYIKLDRGITVQLDRDGKVVPCGR